MIASGFVPSTIIGRIRCDRADLNAPLSSDMRESISRNPVTGGTSYRTAMRPDTGVQPSCTEKSRISRSPHQKIGIEYPVSDTPMTPWSNTELRRTAAIMPAGMPRRSAKRIAQTASSMVAGKSVKNSLNRLLSDHRLPQVAVKDAPDVDAVLNEDRPVEPILL